jgi:hypothetical protein
MVSHGVQYTIQLNVEGLIGSTLAVNSFYSPGPSDKHL